MVGLKRIARGHPGQWPREILGFDSFSLGKGGDRARMAISLTGGGVDSLGTRLDLRDWKDSVGAENGES